MKEKNAIATFQFRYNARQFKILLRRILWPWIGREIIFTFIVGGKPSFTLSLCDSIIIIIIIIIILKLKNHLQ
jgi:hypothetical protein